MAPEQFSMEQLLLFFVTGMTLGSFLNVCIYRLPRGESIVWPASRCPHCRERIKPWHNVPLLSYAFLRGKCASCKEPINPRYPLVEALTGAFFAALYIKFGLTAQVFPWLLLAALLIIITFIDIEFKLILNKITVPGLLVGALLSWLLLPLAPLQIGLGSMLGGGLLVGVAILGKALFGKESMGMGDVKMAAMIGVFLGAKGIALALFFGFLIAGVFSLAGLATKRLQRGAYLPFGPFIAAGTFAYIFFGEAIFNWYLRTSGLSTL